VGVTAQMLIELLGLVPLPVEGGHFRQTWRAADALPAAALPARYGRDKPAGTAIYYLLTDAADGFSALHRLRTDEVGGSPVRTARPARRARGRVARLAARAWRTLRAARHHDGAWLRP
jgi:hypothetical protein